MPYWVYVLRNETASRRYIGQTDNLGARLSRHNTGMVRWTSAYRPWRLAYQEQYETRADAMRRERFLKSGKGREFLDEVERALNRQSPPEAD